MPFDSSMIYRYKMRQEQVESVWNETNVPFSLSFSSSDGKIIDNYQYARYR